MGKSKSKSYTDDVATMSFETAMTELDEIVASAEQDEVPLAASMQRFERGIKLAEHCKMLLEQAERTVKMLSPDGEVTDFE